jgi:hypothetical protein
VEEAPKKLVPRLISLDRFHSINIRYLDIHVSVKLTCCHFCCHISYRISHVSYCQRFSKQIFIISVLKGKGKINLGIHTNYLQA